MEKVLLMPRKENTVQNNLKQNSFSQFLSHFEIENMLIIFHYITISDNLKSNKISAYSLNFLQNASFFF